MKGKKVYSKPFKDEPTKNIFEKFQIIFENFNSTTVANVILVVFLIKFNETQGDIAKDNMKLVTANEVNSITSNKIYKNIKLIKPVDPLLYHSRNRVLNVNQKLNSSSVQFTLSKELLMTDNTEKIKTAFEMKHVRLPRRIDPMIPTNSKFEYYSQTLNYTSMDRKLRNKLKINMRNNSNSRHTGKNIGKKKVKKSKKITERALNTTYDTIYFSKKQDKASHKSTMMKAKYQNKNRINRTNYIKSLRKQIKNDILNNAKLYGLLPRFKKASLGVTLLKDILMKDARKTSDGINSSRIDQKYSTARHIVTTFKSKKDYYATLGRELINDYFTKQKKTTMSLTLKVPDKNDDDDDEDDLEGAYTDIIREVVYEPMTSYNNYRTNYSNDVYKFTHGLTSWNNINNIIAIHLHTSPPTQQDRITCFVACRLQTMPSICPTRKRRVKVLMEDFALPQKTVFEMVWMGLLIVFFVLFCCGTPVFIIEQVKKRKVQPCVDKS